MAMKIGVISDTHDNIEKTKRAVETLEENVETVIHCGDIIAPSTAELFHADFDFYAVRGNNDGEWNLKKTVEEFGKFYNNIAELDFTGKSIAVYHGTEEEIVDGLIEENYDFIFRGHTHQKKLEKHGDATEVNPGGIKLPGQDEDFHFATVDLEEDEIEFHEVQ